MRSGMVHGHGWPQTIVCVDRTVPIVPEDHLLPNLGLWSADVCGQVTLWCSFVMAERPVRCTRCDGGVLCKRMCTLCKAAAGDSRTIDNDSLLFYHVTVEFGTWVSEISRSTMKWFIILRNWPRTVITFLFRTALQWVYSYCYVLENVAMPTF